MTEQLPPAIRRLQRSVNMVHSPVTGWLVLALSLVLTVFAYWFSSEQVERRAKERFEYRATEITDAIEERISIYEQALRGGVGLFTASDHVSREDWRVYVANLHLPELLPGIQGMGYAVPVSPQDKLAFEAQIQAEGFPEFAIKPTTPRDEYSAIVYLEPFDWRNRRAFGFDMWSNGERRAAMQRARDLGEPATSSIITLVQETAKDVQRGFLTYLPVYDTVQTLHTVEERRQHFVGWVYAAFRANDLMKGILGSGSTDISFNIYDGETIKEDALLYESGNTLVEGIEDDELFFDALKLLELQGHPWTISYRASGKSIFKNGENNQPIFILLAGVVIDILLFYVIISLHFINKYSREAAADLRSKSEQSQKALEQQAKILEASERESELFFELAPEAFLVVNEGGTIIKANAAAHGLFQFKPGTLTGAEIETLVPQDRRVLHTKLRDGFFKINAPMMMRSGNTLDALKQNGEVFSAVINLVPIEVRGEKHVVTAVHDVSEQKQIEQTLADAKDKAEAASRAKSEFVANMSHEIRTPLNAVLGAAQLLARSHLSEKQQKYTHMIRSSGEALLGVINDILDFSKIEAGRMEVTPVPFDLDDVLARVASMMSVNVGEKEIELVVKVSPRVHLGLVGDPLRLQQILINLVTNAIKFTETGRVVLAIDVKKPGSQMQDLLDEDMALLESTEQLLHFSVSDTGIGMNQHQQTRLFNAFAQADGSITRRFGGSGLGLVITNQLIQLMGGELLVDSTLGQGSCFHFHLKMAKTEVKQASDKFVCSKPCSVLLIEDQPDTQHALEYLFARWGWPCTVISSLEQLTPDLKAFDYLIVDSEMIYGNTANFIKQLENNPHWVNCVRVVIAPNNHKAEVIDDQKTVAHSILVKPIVANNLVNSLNEGTRRLTGKGLLQEADTDANGEAKFSNVHVLLVEDNIYNQTIAQDMLEDIGITLEIANNGEEALMRVEQSPGLFDIVFMDIHMPVMDGVSATKIMREKELFTGPIIAMTAGVLASEREEYISVGMSDLVPKPIDAKNLFNAITKALPDRLIKNNSGLKNNKDAINSATKKDNKVFNAERLESIAKGKPKRIARIANALNELSQTGAQTLDKIILAIKEQDFSVAQFEAHSLKGVIVNYGGEHLGKLLKELEIQLRQSRNIQELGGEIADIKAALEEFIVHSQQWAAEQQTVLRAQEGNDEEP